MHLTYKLKTGYNGLSHRLGVMLTMELSIGYISTWFNRGNLTANLSGITVNVKQLPTLTKSY